MHWDVPVELSPAELAVCRTIKRAGKFFVFLREIRHQLFDAAFEAELAQAYGTARGTAPLPAALLAMATLLQAYCQVGDADAVETSAVDKRWQLVLGTLGSDDAPFSQGVLVRFRERMIDHDLDKKLLARTVDLAKETGKFGFKNLKVALDSSPLLGAGRVEDTWNLLGRAISTVVDCAAKALGKTREEIIAEADLRLVNGSSLKATIDINWDDEVAKSAALQRLLSEVAALQAWVAIHAKQAADQPPLSEALILLKRVLEQNIEPDPGGGGSRLRKGVHVDRMPSLGDPEMRHGRKSKSKLFNGYKRHIALLANTGLIGGISVTPANQAEHEATGDLLQEVQAHGALEALMIDRGYLASPQVNELHKDGKEILSKPWPYPNFGTYTKEKFHINLNQNTVTCPANVTVQIDLRQQQAVFPSQRCDTCPLRTECTKAKMGTGRSVLIHAQEELLLKLRQSSQTQEGRTVLRQRVQVEHALAKLGAVQGRRARYRSRRKNEMDSRRCAAVVNLQAIKFRSNDDLRRAV